MNPLTTLSTIMGNGSGGFGGLSLVQLGNTSTGVSSPPLALCAQQDISGTLTPECWYFQVGGGNGTNVPDVFTLARTSTQTNVTFQLPYAINLVAGSSTTGGQMTIGAPPSNVQDLSGIPITLVGGFSTYAIAAAKGAPLQIFPGS